MPVITYRDLRVTVLDSEDYFYDRVPVSSISISTQNQLQPSRILANKQNNNFRIGGELKTKISLTFAACVSALANFNLASGMLEDLTGTKYIQNLRIGMSDFSDCYLDSVSMDINNFGPVMVTAELTCLRPPSNTSLQIDSTDYAGGLYNVVDYLAYGNNTNVSGGAVLSDGNIETLSYKVMCDRSYTTSIGQTVPNNVFLNQVEKQLSIKARNIGEFMDYESYGGAINIKPQTPNGDFISEDGFSLSANARIISQNLSVQEGDILAGDIVLSEVVL